MSEVTEPLGAGRIEPRELEQEMRSSYLAYAMTVIVGRALPDVRDGLKPVHRRVLWGMHEGGHQPNRPYVKSARVVGDVMGKYHPHGNQPIYDALARMAQPFSLRYPLVDGQGNFGSIDDDPPAAERYTECRLQRLATEMLRDIDMDTVDFAPNYDESRKEPVVVPARFPNLLVNGSTGIAVGMATNIPPASPGRDRRRGRAADRQAGCERRGPDEAREGPRLPDGRDRRRPQRDPRRLPERTRAHRDARPGSHRGAPGRQERDRRHRAAVRGQEGRRHGRDQEDRRPRQREGDHRGLRPRRPLRQDGDADPGRAQAGRDPAGGPQQALQAHRPPDDVRLQRRRARRRGAEDALAARARPALPRLPARDRHAPLEVRAAPGGEARAHPPGLPDRARLARRRDRADPRLGRHRLRAHGPHGDLRALRGAGPGDPRPPARAPHRARAEGDRGGVRRPPGADRRAARDSRRPRPDRRPDPRGAARGEDDLREVRRPAHGDRRRRGLTRARGHDRRGGHGHRDHALRLHQAPAR